MTHPSTRRGFLAGSGAALALGAATVPARQAAAEGPAAIKVMSFPGLSNYPSFAAEHKGLFAKHGVKVELLDNLKATFGAKKAESKT